MDVAMDLTRKQFDVLEALATSGGGLTQRQLEEKTGHSLGTVNRVLKELTEAGLVKDGALTNAGETALEPYRAKRAIFIAAGFGSRLVPITFNTPKPLVRVHGVRIIDRLIDACLAAGINEIYIMSPHYMFALPVVFAYLLKNIAPRWHRPATILIALMACYIFIWNVIMLTEYFS